ncbi:hypothetical protein VI06_14475 [Aquitalea magnusonii]|nr:hypothetical protein VI06_14475 [Aquitalea magnusonii]
MKLREYRVYMKKAGTASPAPCCPTARAMQPEALQTALLDELDLIAVTTSKLPKMDNIFLLIFMHLQKTTTVHLYAEMWTHHQEPIFSLETHGS